MDGFAAVDFGFAREVLQRGVAALYLVAFVSSLNQFRALLGEHGLLPVPELLARVRRSGPGRWPLRPTLFRWIRYTDRRLVALCVVGIVIAALLVAGIPQLGSPWLPMVCFLLLWLGYMSIVAVGQTFYAFGWEMLLLEAGFLAAFLGCADQPPPTVVIVLFWWLVIRLEFGAGMIKIRGGREWRDLTALMYHHETQPMPGPLSRQAHLLPAGIHRLEVIGNHVAQLGLVWLVVAPILGLWIPGPVPAIVGAVGAGVVIATQLWLVITGNFAWLNWATIVLACSAIGVPTGPHRAVTALPWVIDGLPLPWFVVTCLVGLLYVVISVPAVRNLSARDQLMNASFNRWELANAYGAFGTVTKERIEIVVEGTMDPGGGDPGPETEDWREYGFKGKPGDLHRIPRQFAPYHLRLDWLMWFLPLGRLYQEWFARFLVRLLEADPPTLRLLRHDPFAGERPVRVRAVAYRYRFTTRAQHRETGDVWIRDRRRIVVRPISLSDRT
ncbi:lipase maturation factor family protein [Microbacterium capsulatum]|uniref:Lipase maturation factor family protein n=1 Tax=Microbacterium capsulatum TaxID=3041921 RepID=A0ABU0XJ15_9MICO|nr:lipase maturation factor family protein [Microbacterium sp. ASV81]MDQ4215128.1 lipase maturation factor family protein [Microbacterium sp. ASV81]